MSPVIRSTVSAIAFLAALFPLPRTSLLRAEEPPKTWVDKDTGHRIWRVSNEPNSGGFYFNINAYTPDHKQMIYTAPDGIHVVDLESRQAKLLVPNPPRAAGAQRTPGTPYQPIPGMVHALVAGSKTNSVFYTSADANHVTSVYKADTNTGAIRKLADIPKLPNTSGMSVVSVNADETLIAGTYIEGDRANQLFGQNAPASAPR